MAFPSQSAQASSHFSIKSIISPDDPHLDKPPDSSRTHTTTPNSASSPNRRNSGSELGSNTASRRTLLDSPTSADVGDLHYHQNQALSPHQRDHRDQQIQSPYSCHQHPQHPQQQWQQHYQQQPQQQQLSQYQLPPVSSSAYPLPSLAQPPTRTPSQVQTTQTQQDNYQQASQLQILERGVGGRGTREVQEHEQTSGSPSTYGYPSPSARSPDSPSLGGVTKKLASGKRAPMRSSIACIPCRRSKIKCVNDGEGKAACETCVKYRRNCDYPISPFQTAAMDSGLQFVNVPMTKASVTLKRDDPGPVDRNAERKRHKKFDNSYRLDDQKVGAYNANELLSEQFLKEMMWTEIFDIYHLHFSTELPFIHMPTLKEKMGDKMRARRSDATNLVLLGILTLTARFHSDLGKYTASFIANGSNTRISNTTKPDPWAASEYFADTLTKALGPFRTLVSIASVEHVQALLMLGLYEWTQSKRKNAGMSAWMTVGLGIRMAQGLGFSYHQRESRRRQRRFPPTAPSAAPQADTEGDRSDVEGEAATTASAGTANASADYTATVSITAPDDIVANEVVRRTMFSCFVLDRMLACGKKRTKMVRSKDLQIQLPCPDVSFDLSEKVQTEFLRPRRRKNKVAVDGDAAVASTDSLLARFIQLVDIWGDISKYSFAGGRLVEKRPPWEESKFRKLRGVLDNFYENLPPTFTLTPSNYHRHEHLQASSTYVSLHLLGAVCRIMLHREYIPFIPIRCPRPVGPLDEPTFPEGSAPEGFWEESAEQVFKAAREIVDLTDTCQNRKKLPMSALVVFAVWTAAFVGIYAWHFPQMDMHNHMSRTADLVVLSQVYTPRSEKDCGYRTATHGPTAVVYAALKSMSNYLHMASTYVKYFHDMDLFYEGVKYDYYMAHMDQHGADAAGRMSVRQGGSGGGLEEWKVHGTKVTNNGTIALADDTPAEGSDLSREVTQSDNDNDNGNGAAERRLPLAEDHSLRPRWIAPAGTPLAPRPVNPVAAESNMHGIVYGHEGDARYSGGNMGSLQPAQSQHWNQSAQPTDQMPAAPPGSLDPTQLDPYLRDDPGTDPREFYNVPGLRWEDFSESQNLRWEEWEAASIERFARGGSEDEYY